MCLPNKIYFLTEKQILEIHKSCIQEFGGEEGFVNENMFKSSVYQPQCSFDGKYLYKTIPEMAAAYLISFAKDHCFLHANKRVAFKTCLIFLELNNYKLLLNNDEAIDLTTKCVTGEYAKEDIIKIITDNSIHLN